MLKSFLALVFACLLFTGCSMRSSYVYTPPDTEQVTTYEKIVNKPYDEAWDELVGNMSKSFFVIGQLQKNSGFINANFSLSHPQEYIDCGRYDGEFKFGRDNETYVNHEVTTHRIIQMLLPFRAFIFVGQHPYIVVATPKQTSGVVNVFLKNISENRQRLTVNARYIFGYTSQYTNQTNNSQFVREYDTSFNSSTVGVGNSPVRCISKGTLENSILDFIR